MRTIRNKFKVGDRVRYIDGYGTDVGELKGKCGTIVESESEDSYYRVLMDNPKDRRKSKSNTWHSPEKQLEYNCYNNLVGNELLKNVEL